MSKSGNTIETLSNFFAFNIIKKKSKNIIIISEKSNNPLYLLSQKMKLHYIEHRNYIGGRYSVLSEVGLVPAYLMGININRLRGNILNHFKTNNKNFLKDSSIKLANLLKGNIIKNVIFCNYAPKLEKFLYWNQQLIAESLGKQGKGFLPTVSTVPKDHHSLVQLYLDGPKDKIFYIINSNDSKKSNKSKNIFGKKFNFLKNKSLSRIVSSQEKALLHVMKKKNIPFRRIEINNFSESSIGEFFSYFMIETILIGKILNLNPFNQPSVEEVKILTKKYLNSFN